MNRRLQNFALLTFVLVSAGLMLGQAQTSDPAQARIQKEVRNELLMLPYFGVFDDIEYQVSGDTVLRRVRLPAPRLSPMLRNVVKHIEGVNASTIKSKCCRLPQWTTNFASNCSLMPSSMVIRLWKSTL